ncbi:chemotaxis protein CheW [Granulosicoccus antarcticus]|uniref:Chemotaxis protein CheW n=1 Tax=Granulosicoccus antarcticus IMCC3135 TaxID=1192854 RepID=A0A2Z2NGI3_9GAMM|nr:chemotaxis protein CheW [Granulosicoccus antarcticus]ASJ70396.1 Chemotaxis protein CheW [Granulosicoccus antarcticus IMCC3135]
MNQVTPQNYCTFYLDKYYFGIEVEQVQEIIRFQEITPVALAPDVVKGLINLRGQIVTAIDLRSLLELPERAEGEVPMNIVVRTPLGAFSLLADRVGDVLELSDDSFEAPPDNLSGMARELIQRAYKLDNTLLLTMAIKKVVSSEVLNRRQSAA